MKKLFVAIRQQKIDLVKEIMTKKPELIACVAKQPPKKDDGQSPLQVAIKSSKRNFEIVHYLLDLGADVNFIEDESCCNVWRAPVLHDAIMAAIYCARHTTEDFMTKKLTLRGTKKEADASYGVLKRMLEMGADIKQNDSYGNTSLARAILDAKQFLPSYNYQEDHINDRPVLQEEIEDIQRIVDILGEYGANSQIHAYHKNLGMTLYEFIKKEYVIRFLPNTE